MKKQNISYLMRIWRGKIFLALALMLSIGFATTASALTTISMSLDFGSRGSDVTSLQTFLATDSSLYPEGLVTGYFGSLTRAAVRRFQAQYGIDVVGRVGPITRQKINELILAGGMGGGQDLSAPVIYNATTTLMINGTGTTTATTPRSATISWITSEPAQGKVFFSNVPLMFTEASSARTEPTVSGSVMSDSLLTGSKSINIPNLSANTTYYYMIEAVDANGNVSVTWPSMFVSK